MRIIAGVWRGRRLNSVKGRGVRPTTDRIREAWMAALGGHLAEARVLDLFAGSGALGLEALSRGAREVTFVEKARAPLQTLKANVTEVLEAGREEFDRVLQEIGVNPAEYFESPANPTNPPSRDSSTARDIRKSEARTALSDMSRRGMLR